VSNLQFSVALGTFNGADFLKEQLDSITQQYRRPDELVIVDDCSTDATLQIIADFAGRAPFPVNLQINEQNLGVRKNFELAIRFCTGDIIALADQDDFWHPNKLRRIEKVFQTETEVGAVASDALLVDARLKPLGHTLWQALGFDAQKQRNAQHGGLFREILRHNVVSGNTLAFRKSFRMAALPIPDVWAHDAWTVILVASLSEVRLLAEPLISYRQHGRNQIGAQKNSLSKWGRFDYKEDPSVYFWGDLERCLLLAERLVGLNSMRPHGYVMVQLLEKIQHLENRLKVRINKWRLLPKILKDCWCQRYHYYSGGWSSFLRDLIF
jgi:glycosyltransferase involved in cell wall biosynthesis